MADYQVRALPQDNNRSEGKAWPYPTITDDYNNHAPIWREISEKDADWFLECVPPVYLPGGFMCGEAARHEYNNGHEEAVRLGVVTIEAADGSRRYFARETTRSRWAEDRAGLLAALAGREVHP